LKIQSQLREHELVSEDEVHWDQFINGGSKKQAAVMDLGKLKEEQATQPRSVVGFVSEEARVQFEGRTRGVVVTRRSPSGLVVVAKGTHESIGDFFRVDQLSPPNTKQLESSVDRRARECVGREFYVGQEVVVTLLGKFEHNGTVEDFLDVWTPPESDQQPSPAQCTVTIKFPSADDDSVTADYTTVRPVGTTAVKRERDADELEIEHAAKAAAGGGHSPTVSNPESKGAFVDEREPSPNSESRSVEVAGAGPGAAALTAAQIDRWAVSPAAAVSPTGSNRTAPKVHQSAQTVVFLRKRNDNPVGALKHYVFSVHPDDRMLEVAWLCKWHEITEHITGVKGVSYTTHPDEASALHQLLAARPRGWEAVPLRVIDTSKHPG
jgi:hypothetical protein